MSDLSHNIKFNYLYRDAGNYKNFGSVIFANPDNLTTVEIESLIKLQLIDGEFFIPEKWDIPSLAFPEIIEDLDHEWNEFENIALTQDIITEKISITNFLTKICRISNKTK